MDDQLDELLAQAGIAPVVADGLVVVDDERIPPGLEPPYLRVYTTIERPADAAGNALLGRSSTWTTRWYYHHIGATDTAARALAMRTRAVLLDLRPVVAGRSCGLIRQEAVQPPRRDERAGPLNVDLVVVYRMTSTG